MPAATSLLQPIERFAKPPDPLRGLLLKTLRLSHVDFLLELTIEVGRGDVHRLEFQVLQGSQGEYGSNRRPFGCGSKGFIVVKARAL